MAIGSGVLLPAVAENPTFPILIAHWLIQQVWATAQPVTTLCISSCADTLKTVLYVDGHEVDLQYSNWLASYPIHENNKDCVIASEYVQWYSYECADVVRTVCQSWY